MICDTFLTFEETEQSKVFPNAAFGYSKITVERPLRLKVDFSISRRNSFRLSCTEGTAPLTRCCCRQAPNWHDLLGRIEDSSKPVVMAIHGAALGGGLERAIAGHYRIAAPATQIGLPEVNLCLSERGRAERLRTAPSVDRGPANASYRRYWTVVGVTATGGLHA